MTPRRTSPLAVAHPADPDWPEVNLIAEHRQLSERDAATHREALLQEDWGPAAIRQMIYDQWCKAPDPVMAEWIWQIFDRFSAANPVTVDRRNGRR